MEAYKFEPGTAQLHEQANGTWYASFNLSAFDGQTFTYDDKGINAQNIRVIDVNIHGDESGEIKYHSGQTMAFTRGLEASVELASKKGDKRKDLTGITFP